MDNKKYELLTNDTIEVDGHTLYRIRALKDFVGIRDGFNSERKIKNGELGGYIENETNLSHDGNCWVAEFAMVYGDDHISGDVVIW